ncbi:type IV secretion system DNA-binding domain-containing protein [Agrobacterium rubi]|nr:type IV secretion system DNA-binding domain-containing protein [Agrobacterium rubi]NTF23761.1 type IV secretion system DNA-binding domain-containing protein [Agrobacterium rubi]
MNAVLNPTNFTKSNESILFLGRDVSGQEMWSTTDMVKTHMFVSGSTGSGKTELLTSLMVNAMAWGSGAVFIDGKGDISFPAKLHAAATAIGREQDLLILNFMKGNVEEGDGISSHTINPFAILTADELCQIMSSTMPRNSYDSMWSERAVALMNCIVNTLVWLRDNRDEPLTIGKIRDCLILNNLILLRKRISEIPTMSPLVLAELDFYLGTLPGYVAEKFTKQSSTVHDQHGYLSMQWTRTANLLCSTYGHILNVEIPEIDIRDVVLNRRVLVVLLPSLERSSSDISNIGSLMVGMIKSMLGQALRSPVEGTWAQVVRNRITTARYPFMIVMDEIGQYLTDGMGMMAQQARSLNVGLIFATQDFDSLSSKNPRETEAIIANTNTKIFMKAENPNSRHLNTVLRTYTDAINRAKMRTAEIAGAEKNLITTRLLHHIPVETSGHMLRSRLDALNIQTLESAMAEPELDLAPKLKGFKAGQMLVTHGGDCVEGRASYIAIEGDIDSHEIRLQRFASIRQYGKIVEDRRAAEKRAGEVLMALRAAKMAGGPGEVRQVTMVSRDTHFAMPPSLVDVASVYTLWAQYLASIVHEDSDPKAHDSKYHELWRSVAMGHEEARKIMTKKESSEDRYDFLADLLKRAEA